ncbi:recombinase family protein [Fictibacillus barbaricus]|uniref:DNA invertase Pin-like site-specific DNA recombinase n=1 Tax=Fictibacillus barbaricus TaxID=182136 RepID=A0ABU1U5P7_9BACL|nr:recombinase family protein [Fictibacillus barbaricus]MDR7074731.1 DNA invertase Pin-like site-specific DNA recombinase [Fictibacillus barbaricus]
MKKAAIYIRVSTKEQVGEDKFGLPVQLVICEDYCTKNEHQIYKVFEDGGKSGGYEDLDNDLNKRPALNELLTAANLGEFNIVIVPKLDRLARSLYAQLWVEKELRKHDIEVISVSEPFSGQDPVMTMMRQMMGVFAEFEKNRINERLYSAKMYKRKLGGFIGGQDPLGYYSLKGSKKLYIKEDKIKTIRRAFELKGSMSLRKIANILNNEGYTSRDSKPFTPMQIKRIFDREPLYRGEMEAPAII